jgi:outer membrane receptor protein involved in Fe transport
MYSFVKAVLSILLLGGVANATIFGSVHGLIHDPEHRPVKGATVRLAATSSAFEKTATSADDGTFSFSEIPIGEYELTVNIPGFQSEEQKVLIGSDHDVRVHFSLQVAKVAETVEVTDVPVTVDSTSSTSSTMISRASIAETPGADQTNSLAMITSNVPGSYMVHDQLHIRGGHQVSWLLDGVPVPNTNIASNVGPQFDPKDIDYLEVQRGGYDAEYGDRTYGVFNVVTRSGFERNRQAELVASYGSFHNTEDQISFGDHSQRFAYYGSMTGYRTDLGLETPIPDNVHDQASGLGGFGSIIFNKDANDQLRLVTSVRGDHYQVPIDPNGDTAFNRDVEDEGDSFANFSWIHTAGQGLTLTLAPFYHYNRAHYVGKYVGTFDGDPADAVTIPEDDRISNYFGGTAMVGYTRGKHTAHAGLQVWGQHDNQLFGVTSSDPVQDPLRENTTAWGSVETFFLEDQFRLTNWFTLNGGVRLTHFQGPEQFDSATSQTVKIIDNAADPRIGAALRLPRLNWVLRGFWGRYYQPPPLLTVAGTLLDQCAPDNCGFLPLHGERDEQVEVGLAIPFRGWTFDLSAFRTTARNFFDHDVLGNSNIFFPLTIDRARIRGFEATVTSPKIFRRLQVNAVYSHQYAEGSGAVTGGLTDFEPPEEGLFFLDHDQRHTLSASARCAIPWRMTGSFTTNYGSGFVDGDGPNHLPSHTTYDLALAKQFGESWTVRVTALNITDNRYLLDNSNTFGGTHYAFPLQIMGQVKFRFRY